VSARIFKEMCAAVLFFRTVYTHSAANMDTSTGLIIGLALVGLVALAYFGGLLSSAGGPKTSELPAMPAMPWSSPAAATPAAASMVAPPTLGERQRMRMNRGNVFGPAVAAMNADQEKRGAVTVQEFVGQDAAEGYVSTVASGNDWASNMVDGLSESTKKGHAAYVAEFKKSRGGRVGSMGQVSTSPAYGMEFSKGMYDQKGLWPLLRGRAPLEGKHSSGQAQTEGVDHCYGEDAHARRIGRPQYPGVDTSNPLGAASAHVSPQAVQYSRDLSRNSGPN
jgi:hypothetical protein